VPGGGQVAVGGHKGAAGRAAVIAELPEAHYPKAKKVRLVPDNRNTPAGGSLDRAFPPEQARALDERPVGHLPCPWPSAGSVRHGPPGQRRSNRPALTTIRAPGRDGSLAPQRPGEDQLVALGDVED